MTWSKTKRELQKFEKPELLGFIKRLYDLNKENKSFFEANFTPSSSEAPKYYKEEISKALYPDVQSSTVKVDFQRGRKAISGYKKACPKNLWGQTDLMMHFVEQGSYFTLDLGDMESRFYDSLGLMIDSIVKLSAELSPVEYSHLAKRFTDLEDCTAGKIGWGYADFITDVTHQFQRRLKE